MTGERVDLGSERYDALYTMDRALCVGEAFDSVALKSLDTEGMIARLNEQDAELHTLRAQVAALAGERAADKARLDWMEAQFADHNRDCNLTFNRFQYDQELSLDAEGASWSRMTIRSNLDAARGGEG